MAESQGQTRAALDSLAAAQADARQLQQQLGLLVGGLGPIIALDNSLQHALTTCDSTDSFNVYLQQLLQQVYTPVLCCITSSPFLFLFCICHPSRLGVDASHSFTCHLLLSW